MKFNENETKMAKMCCKFKKKNVNKFTEEGNNISIKKIDKKLTDISFDFNSQCVSIETTSVV